MAVEQANELYERGLVIDSLDALERGAPLREWQAGLGCLLASRIAAQTGDQKLAARLAVRARRAEPGSALARAQYCYHVLWRMGPLAIWRNLEQWREGTDSAEDEADLLAIRAVAAAELRDFERAHALLDRAGGVHRRNAWLLVQRAYVLEKQDRPEDALAVARDALQAHRWPFYRSAVQACARMLQLLDRDAEAISLLEEARGQIQNAAVAAQAFGLLSENGRWPEAREALAEYERLSPHLSRRGQDWLNAQRARVEYRSGSRQAAASLAARVDDPFHASFVTQLLRDPPQVERVELAVSFVRQHFKTCAPATLAAIGRYWKLDADHLRIAEATCYDGTPLWQQRRWAQDNGWKVREFRVTWDSAIELLERGLPFGLSMTEATSAHMVAVIGFDRTRGSFLVRDPSEPYVVEHPAQALLERYASTGPRGILFMPEANAARADGVTLPDAPLYDVYHELRIALGAHDRVAAIVACERLQAMAPDQMLALEAALDIATYDANVTRQATILDSMLALHPEDAHRVLRRFDCLRHASREERIAFLSMRCAKRTVDPALILEYGRALTGNANDLKKAHRWLALAERLRSTDPQVIAAQADFEWARGGFEQATDFYRLAASADGFREGLFRSWFIACRRTGRTESALLLLQGRFAQFGSRSEQPAVTLAWALRELDQPIAAIEVLQEALRLRPGDGQVSLQAASLYSLLGRADEAHRQLAVAVGKVHENDRLRCVMEVEERFLNDDAVLQHSRALLEREPLALEAHGCLTRAMFRRAGQQAVQEHLGQALARFPHHSGLLRLHLDWSRSQGPAILRAAAERLVAAEPSDAWARRELAMACMQAGDVQAALDETARVLQIEPLNSYSHSVAGHAMARAGRIAEACESFRKATQLSIDNSDAISRLLELAPDDASRARDLQLIESELRRQVVDGEGLLQFMELARPLIGKEALLGVLRDARNDRPDLWQSWVALALQLLHAGDLAEAQAVAVEATERFPYVPRVWLESAAVHRARNALDDEVASSRRAVELSPSWNRAIHSMADALERGHRLDEAREVYQRAIPRLPMEADLHTALASIDWRQGREQDALAGVERALRLSPTMRWAWDLVSEWATQCGEPDRPARLARELCDARPGDPLVWLNASHVLPATPDLAAPLHATERALALDPGRVEAWDRHAELLAHAERFEDAAAACERGKQHCRFDLQVLDGRLAWIEAQARRLPAAIAKMTAVMQANRGYVWGWRQLADWNVALGNLDGAATALRELRALLPHEAWVHRQLGLLLVKQHADAAAAESFSAAFELSPLDVAAAHNLFDLQIKAGEFAAAGESVSKMQLHQPGAATLSAAIRLALRVEPERFPEQLFDQLCIAPDPDPWPVASVVQALQGTPHADKAVRVIRAAIASGRGNPELGCAVVNLLAAREQSVLATLRYLGLEPGELRRRAGIDLLGHLVTRNRRWLSRLLIALRSREFRADDQSWGQAGYALTSNGDTRCSARWHRDWRDRQGVQAWMLFNLCLSLRDRGRYALADEVARHVVSHWNHREGAADMYLFLAVETALTGDIELARAQVAEATPRNDIEYDQQLLAITRALIDVRGATDRRDRQPFRDAIGRLDACFSARRMLRYDRDARRTLRRAVAVLMREGGGAPVLGWYLGKAWSPALLTVVFLLYLVRGVFF